MTKVYQETTVVEFYSQAANSSSGREKNGHRNVNFLSHVDFLSFEQETMVCAIHGGLR